MNNGKQLRNNVWVEINRDHFLHNVALAKKQTNDKVQLMAIVKGNAYGHGMDALVPIINESDIDRVGVYRTEEAIELVQKGIDKTVHQLTYSNLEEMVTMINNGIIITIATLRQVDDLMIIAHKWKRKITVHIRVDVNNGGIGLSKLEVPLVLQKLKSLKNIKIEGVFTHIPSTYLNDEALMEKEIGTFEQIRQLIKQLLRDEDIIFHAGSSPALYGMNAIYYDMVRIGNFIYGLSSFKEVKRSKKYLKPVMAIKSRVLDMKEIKNETISGYSETSSHNGYRKIATVPIGYYDVPFLFHYNSGNVLIEGKRCSIIGKPNMNHMIVDITSNNKVRIGSEVVLVGKQNTEQITFEEVAEHIGIGRVHCEMIGLINNDLCRKIVTNEAILLHDTFNL